MRKAGSWIVRSLGRLYSVIENTVTFYLTEAIVVFIMFFITTEVVGRYLFNYSFFSIVDLVQLCILGFVFASLSAVQGKNAHINMDLLPDRLKGKRAGSVLGIINYLFTGAVALLMIYVSVKAALISYQGNVMTETGLFPSWPAAIFIPIGWLLMCIRVGVQIKQEVQLAKRAH